MTVVAGIDVGNNTTEIVLARIRDGTAEPITHAQAPTRGRKGSKESLAGAAALLHRLEVDAAVSADELVLSALRPVDTATAPSRPRRRRARRCAACVSPRRARRPAPVSASVVMCH